MNVYRTAALAVAACATALSVAACQGGLSTPGPASSTPPGSPAAAPSSAPAAASSSSPAAPVSTGSSSSSSGGTGAGGTVSLGGSLGNFPVPPGATVLDNGMSGSQHDIVLGGVDASEISSFYTTALPQAGFTISQNTSASGQNFSGTAIVFSGHGYKGDIGSLSGLGITGLAGLGGLGGTATGITLTPQ